MTDTPVEEPNVEAAPEEAPAKPTSENCWWCGAYHEARSDEDPDWLCPSCERYQDAMTCPTCGGLARVSLLPADMVPAAATPKKGKK